MAKKSTSTRSGRAKRDVRDLNLPKGKSGNVRGGGLNGIGALVAVTQLKAANATIKKTR